MLAVSDGLTLRPAYEFEETQLRALSELDVLQFPTKLREMESVDTSSAMLRDEMFLQ